MSGKSPATAITVAALVVVLTVLWFRLDAQTPAPAVWTIVFDPSGSQPRDCAAEASMARMAMAQMSESGGSFRALKIGERSTANSPVLVMTETIKPRVKRVLREARDDGGAWVAAELVRKCESASPGLESAVYIALRDAVDDAAHRGAPNSPRQVMVRSDMRETVLEVIQRALNQPHGTALSGLPPKINNDRVTIFACGFSETRGNVGRTRAGSPIVFTRPRSADAGDRLVEVWLSLFSNPDGVQIVPFCDRSETTK